jgi:hypothetical protein
LSNVWQGRKASKHIVRKALSEYACSYTGELTLRGLQKRVNEIDRRLMRIENSLMKNAERF